MNYTIHAHFLFFFPSKPNTQREERRGKKGTQDRGGGCAILKVDRRRRIAMPASDRKTSQQEDFSMHTR